MKKSKVVVIGLAAVIVVIIAGVAALANLLSKV